MRSFKLVTVSALMLASALPAFAHTGTGWHEHDLVSGFAHPFSGIDHVLAMLAVGFWAALAGQQARLVWPLGFVSCVAAGALSGVMGVTLPVTEVMIAASVAGLGLVVALGWQASMLAGLSLCALFGLAHGMAHGVEMPVDANGLVYALGFLSTTGLLHGCGLGMGLKANPLIGKVAGLGLAVIGAGLLASSL